MACTHLKWQMATTRPLQRHVSTLKSRLFQHMHRPSIFAEHVLKTQCVQALEIMDTLVIPGSDKMDVRDKDEVTFGTASLSNEKLSNV